MFGATFSADFLGRLTPLGLIDLFEELRPPVVRRGCPVSPSVSSSKRAQRPDYGKSTNKTAMPSALARALHQNHVEGSV